MRLSLITTTHHVLALDDQERFYLVHSGQGLYYGIAAEGNVLYLTCRGAIAGPDCEATRAREQGSVLVFDSSTLQQTGELRPPGFPIRDVHGAACIGGKLFVVCSYDNLVAIYDPAGGTWRKWYPAADVTARDRDVHHFNTISLIDGRIVLLAHNNGPSDLLFFDPASLEPRGQLQIGHQAHNIFRRAGAFGVCSSAEGLLVSTTGWALRTGGFPRGLDFTDNSILAGISQVAERANRARTSGVLRRFTPAWSHLCDYLLEDVGMVLDILSLEVDPSVSQRLEPFAGARRFSGSYCDQIPADTYIPGMSHSPSLLFHGEWHGPEHTNRWTAAREARMTVVTNPGESTLSVAALSAFPGRYHVDVFSGRQRLGRMRWKQAGEQTATFALPPGAGVLPLSFRVPHLWQPVRCIPGSNDERSLGIGILSVRLS